MFPMSGLLQPLGLCTVNVQVQQTTGIDTPLSVCQGGQGGDGGSLKFIIGGVFFFVFFKRIGAFQVGGCGVPLFSSLPAQRWLPTV